MIPAVVGRSRPLGVAEVRQIVILAEAVVAFRRFYIPDGRVSRAPCAVLEVSATRIGTDSRGLGRGDLGGEGFICQPAVSKILTES